MRTHRTPFLFAALLGALALFPACGGDDDGDTPDAAGSADADTTPDAPGGGGSAIGQACTAGTTPQGDCPDGYLCVGLQGGAGSWCTKECTGPADTSCQTDYAGTGLPICLLTVQDEDPQTPDLTVCIVMCEDNTGQNVCPATDCDGTCPTPLVCNDTGQMWSGCY